MPRYRGTDEAAGTLVGRLLILIAKGKETSLTLAAKLGVSPRQVNRYLAQLQQAGWQIERRGSVRLGTYWFKITSPRIVGAA